MTSVIIGSGSYIPNRTIKNEAFLQHTFYDEHHQLIDRPAQEIVDKFQAITGIEERRYVEDDLVASDIGAIAARRAIEDAGIDPETLDYIIVADNFGDVPAGFTQTDLLPSLASRIKQHLGIENPNCVSYDIIFGCPGWVEGMIQAYAFMRAGMAKRALIIGTETLSRVVDDYDRDGMIFADGAGAVVVEMAENEGERGILAVASQSYTKDEAGYLFFGKSNLPNADPNMGYIKMHGRKIYEFALSKVPEAIQNCLNKANLHIRDIKKIFIHQANEKMDHAIIKRLFKLYGEKDFDESVMPISIRFLGNSSVATIPTLFDLIRKAQLDDHGLHEGDYIVFASVGAGMNINAIAYRY
ncbi:MAG: ketoacyl-ACP synthase III [Saprospiraceae bacterium]|nr:ketoacyl-ACP synthase III [Saprospiraceae bacterium]